MPARTVERIAAPNSEVFREEYLRKQRPVILQGLFAGQPIDRIRTEEDACAMFGELPLPVQNEYLAGVAEAEARGAELPAGPQNMRLDDYLAFIRLHPGTRKMCSEKPTPPELLQSFSLPPYDKYEDAISAFFVGNAGNFAHLHFDGDYRHVLFYLVFGDKRFILIPPRAAPKMAAIGNQALWCLENFAEEDKRRFLEFVGGYDCVLHAGETLYMPAGIWHYVEYTTNSMSYSLRFGRNEFTRFFSTSLHMNVYLQNIAWKMADESEAKEKYLDAFTEISQERRRSYPTAREKYMAIQALLEKVCKQICPEYPRHEYGVPQVGKLAEIYQTCSEQIYRPVYNPVQMINGWGGVRS